MVEHMRHKQNPKSLNCSIFQAAFYIFTRNILRTQCGVSCVKSDGVVVVVQIYSIDKDANETLPLYLTVSRKIPEVLQKSKNLGQLKSRLFSFSLANCFSSFAFSASCCSSRFVIRSTELPFSSAIHRFSMASSASRIAAVSRLIERYSPSF